MLHVRFKNSDLFLAKYLCMQSKLKAILYLESISQFICCFYLVPWTSTRNSSDLEALLLFFFLFASIPFLIFNSKWWNLLLLAPTERLKDGDSLFIHMQVEFISRNAIHSHHFPFSAVLLSFFLFFFFEKQTQSLRDYHSLIWP